MHIASTYPELMAIVNYFEKSYLGLSNPSDTRTVEPAISMASSTGTTMPLY